MISCIIIDDEETAINVIASHIQSFKELNLITTFTNPTKAYEFLKENTVQLVFIDVQMPHLNGIKFIELLRGEKGNDVPYFVLTTGFDKYAISGFEQGAYDYLLKPVTLKRFKIPIDRLISSWKKHNSLMNVNAEKDYFFIESDGSKLKLNFLDIAYIESDRNSIHIYERNEKRTFYKKMHYIESLLTTNQNFIRVHKSFIVSVKFIEQVKGSDIILNISGKQKTISIGGTYKESVLKRLK